jgi:MOSC domain-containing protein YiiM
MKIISINVSTGKTVMWKGRPVPTGIFKEPVSGNVMIHRLNIEGDQQSDLRVHGGANKAIYSYDIEDYFWWNRALGRELKPGAFGENLTTEGMIDREISIGDTFKVGTAVLQAVQPRLPCYKLGLKFDDEHMPDRFMAAERWGIYYRVLEEGTVAAGDSVESLTRDRNRVRIADIPRLLSDELIDEDLIVRALQVEAMAPEWKNKVLRLAKQAGITV